MIYSYWYTKELSQTINDTCPVIAKVFGVDEYHHKIKGHISDICKTTPELLDSLVLHDRFVLATGAMGKVTALTQTTSGQWMNIYIRKQRTEKRLILTELSAIPIEDLYCGWPSHLNYTTQHLVVRHGLILSSKDLTLLHRYLMGMPRKTMADKYFVTVKAIEKRLTRIRDQLHVGPEDGRTLQQALKDLNLIPFLLAQANWFEPVSNHIVHR